MPRNRMIKPEFWSDEKTGMLSFFDKCAFIGMWNFADDEGLIRANPMYLKASVFPYDSNITPQDIEDSLCRLSGLELIFQYQKNHQSYLWIIKFRVHQRIDKPQKPQNPAPSIQNNDYKNAIFKRDGFICHICGEFTDISCGLNKVGSKFPSIDHVLAKSNGGSDYPTNLKTACISCNKSKGGKMILGTFSEHSQNGMEQEKRKEKKLKEKKENIYTSVVDHLNLKTQKNFKHTSRKTRALIDARLNEGFIIEDFFIVIDNKSTDWINDAKMIKFLRPETLFGTKFESYLNDTPREFENTNNIKPTTYAQAQNYESREMARWVLERRKQNETDHNGSIGHVQIESQ